MGDDSSRTNPTLLDRLRRQPTDETAWAEFVRRYEGRIYSWCRQRGFQEDKARDAMQMVLLKLIHEMPKFIYDSSKTFRGWLRTITHNVHSDLVEMERRCRAAHGWTGPEYAPSAAEELVSQQDREFEFEALEEAKRRVRLRVHPHTWEIFDLTELQQVPAPEVAARKKMRIANVYAMKSKVRGLLKKELEAMQGPPND